MRTRLGPDRWMWAPLLLVIVLAGVVVVTPPPVAASSIPAEVVTSCYQPCNYGGLDTRGTGLVAQTRLTTAGYVTSRTWDVTAASALGVATSGGAAVWIMMGHGGPGAITTCTDSTNPNCPWSYIDTDTSVYSACVYYPNICLVGRDLHRVRLMVFMGCNTGLNGPDGLNLLDMANSEGAKATVGFGHDIGFGPTSGNAWTSQFFNYLNAGSGVSRALAFASAYVGSLNGGNHEGYNYYMYDGGTVTIAPPQWG
jgi:hypothetical protein